MDNWTPPRNKNKTLLFITLIVGVFAVLIAGLFIFRSLSGDGEVAEKKDGSSPAESDQEAEATTTPPEDGTPPEDKPTTSLDVALRQISSQPSQKLTNKGDLINRLTSEELNYECTTMERPNLGSWDDFAGVFGADEMNSPFKERLDKLRQAYKNLALHYCEKDDLDLIVIKDDNPNSSYEDFRDLVALGYAISDLPITAECEQEYGEVWFADSLITYSAWIQAHAEDKRRAHLKALRVVAQSLNGQLHDKCPMVATSPEEVRKANDIKMITKRWGDYTASQDFPRLGPKGREDFKRDILDQISLEYYDQRKILYINLSSLSPLDGNEWPAADTIHVWEGAWCNNLFSMTTNYGQGDYHLLMGSNATAMVYIYDGVVRCANL